ISHRATKQQSDLLPKDYSLLLRFSVLDRSLRHLRWSRSVFTFLGHAPRPDRSREEPPAFDRDRQLRRTRPRRVAIFTASVRLVTPSFSNRWPRWVFTVRSLMPSSLAIS